MDRVETRIEMPADQAVGTHADAASVWHTRESFVIDFLALKQPVHAIEEDNGDRVLVHDMLVGCRIRIPPTHVIELMKALESELSRWETETGQRPPVDPPHPDLT